MEKADISWNLSDLFKSIDDPNISLSIKKIEEDIASFEKAYKGKVIELSGEDIKNAYIALEGILSPMYNISQYASLLYSKDTSSNKVKQFKQKTEFLLQDLYNKLIFFDLEIGLLPADRYSSIIGFDKLSNYSYHIEQTYKKASHSLSEDEEKVINLKDLAGVRSFRKLYTDLTSSFQFEFELEGEIKRMNASELRALRHHKDKEVRRGAMKVFFDRYKDNAIVLSNIYNAILKNEKIEKDLRNYESSISIMNIENDLEDSIVENLMEVTTRSYSLVERYYKIKSKLLNIDDMTPADIYAPIYNEGKKYSWTEAKDIVLSSFSSFDNDFYKIARSMFDEDRIDAFVSPFKLGGAFCSSSSPDKKPYILLNFLGRYKDISTIAHELGHSVHDVLASKQSLINYHPILPLAETASVFSEMIITDFMLKQESSKTIKKAILTDKLEDIFATSHRQNMFSRFEILNHENIVKKSFITEEELCLNYEKELKLMFGKSLLYPDEYKWEWSSIPHIFEVPFYVYSYNFANLLVISLYQKYKEDGADFNVRFKEFLSLGSSKGPLDITKIVGVSIKDNDFWDKSFLYIEGLIDNLELLINES